jgi:4-amino-4-deoxy-L-arabinose transferase-like glycosyltransferase
MFLLEEDKSPSRLLLGLALLFLVVNLFVVGNSICLWDDDEAAYAGFAQRMLETGDWVNPQFTWSDVHRKTPFHFWSIAVAYLIFGVNEFAVRFPSALAVLLTALALYSLSGPLWGKARAAWAAIIFSSSFLCISMGKMSLTDAWLMFFQTIAILSLLRYLQQPSWRWNLLFWTAIAIGVLVKGPPILILAGGFWLGMAAMHPQRRHLIGTHPWFFGLLSLLPFVLWAYLSYRSDGGKLLTFLYEWYVLRRIGGSVFGQSGPPGYHLLVAFIAFFPWLPFFVKGLWRALRYARRDEQSIGLLFWLIFGWVFYELMSSKLPSYAMGAHPAFALATAAVLVDYLDTTKEAKKIVPNWTWWLTATLWLLFSISIFGFFYIKYPENSFYILFVSIPMALLALLLPWLKSEQKVLNAALLGALSLALIWGIGGRVLDLTPAKSSKRIVAAMQQEISQFELPKTVNAAMLGFTAQQARMSFPFYLERSFKEAKELTMEESLAALKGPDKLIILMGENGFAQVNEALQKDDMKGIYLEKAPEWHSLNDQLKPHPFWIVHNFKKNK